jgi:hypothetical protein
MADWSKPTTLSNYVTFVDEAKARDVDAITLQSAALIGTPVGAIKLVRAPAIKFQEWDGAAFQDRVMSVEGGGTGANNAATARGNLGLGSMATQNANAIAVTGGTIANLSSSGTFSHVGGLVTIGPPTTGPAIQINQGPSATHTVHLQGNAVPSSSFGMIISAGYNATDWALYVRNSAAAVIGLRVDGNMTVFCPNRLVIPVGTDAWAPA